MKKILFTILIILLSLLILFGGWVLYMKLTSVRISVKFKDIRPLPKRVEVLYKGIKVGRVISARHTDDYEYTFVIIELRPKYRVLPKNLKAELRIEKRKNKDYDYIELFKQGDPQGNLCTGCIIAGESMVDTNTYLANQSRDTLEGIKENLYQASVSLNDTLKSLDSLLGILYTTVEENQKNINTMTNNLSETTSNINSLTDKINKSVKEEAINQSLNDIQNSLSNIKKATDSLNGVVDNISEPAKDVTSVLPSAIDRTECIIKNVEDITCGVATTLKKPFGGIRLIFGKTITKGQNCNCYNK